PPVAYPGEPPAADAPPRNKSQTAQLTVTLVPESKTGRVSKAQVTMKSAEAQHVSAQVEGADPAQFKFAQLDTGYYELEVRLPDGQVCTRPLLIENEEPRELTIVCPEPRKRVAMELTIASLPEKVRARGFESIEVYVWAGPVEVSKSRWISSNRMAQKIRFDARTGKVLSIEVAGGQRQQNIDLTAAPDEERRVFLPVGAIGYGFEASNEREPRMYVWPNGLNTTESNDGLKHIVEPGEKSWKLELPQKYLDELLDEAKGIPTSGRTG
ncbi:MAG TPA: hypothetical protein VHB77_06845, partial [Planctomycetaceae bacterium]|nr:hypothetical protein [Planctomycetaceae bacterium]